MKRSGATLEDVADFDNLAEAFWRASRGVRYRPEVMRFSQNLDAELGRMRQEILELSVGVGSYRTFFIRDPKLRQIHAPVFRERVLHHAVMNVAGPRLDGSLVDDTFACRVGKGVHAAAARAQGHLRRFPWYVKIDIKSYFRSIDHARLKELLERRFKKRGLLELLSRIIDSHHDRPGKGLPIGALTSQHFANFYLSGLDRFLLETLRVRGIVRYMDDVVWWVDDRTRAKETLRAAREQAREALGLTVKDSTQIQRSSKGLTLCGFRILPGALRLTARRKRRYRAARERWESAYKAGLIDETTLQAGYMSALAITLHAEARSFRLEQLERVPGLNMEV